MIRDVSCTFAGSGTVLGSFRHALNGSCHSIKCVRTRSLPKSAQMAVSRQGQNGAAPSHGSAYMCYSCIWLHGAALQLQDKARSPTKQAEKASQALPHVAICIR